MKYERVWRQGAVLHIYNSLFRNFYIWVHCISITAQEVNCIQLGADMFISSGSGSRFNLSVFHSADDFQKLEKTDDKLIRQNFLNIDILIDEYQTIISLHISLVDTLNQSAKWMNVVVNDIWQNVILKF